MNQKIVVIIPTYNEVENIQPLVDSVSRVLPEAKILFVDDNSPDGTAGEIRRIQDSNKKLLLIEREAKLGLGSAYRAAFEYIKENDLADFIVMMDGDLSHPIEELPRMIDKLGKYDAVIGSRYIEGGGVKNWPRYRRILSHFGNHYARTFMSSEIKDVTSGFYVIKAEPFLLVCPENLKTSGYAFQIDLKNLMTQSGLSIIEHPITFLERGFGKSKLSGKVLLEAVFFPLKKFLGFSKN